MDTSYRVLLGIVLAAIILLCALPSIHRWERTNGYPFGRLCDIMPAGECTSPLRQH